MDALSLYDYELPEELIAQHPLADRAGSRLLHLERASGSVHHRQFRDCVDLLESGDLLVVNNTRVSARRLFGQKSTGAQVEALLLREVASGVFDCLLKPAKRLPPGTVVEFDQDLRAVVLDYSQEEIRRIQFVDPTSDPARQGEVPLPPYIRAKLDDEERYQTVYGSQPGSAAAPTAGLHFTRDILDALDQKGVGLATVTLHVGVDTFRPVQVENAADHVIHGELCEMTPETATAVKNARGRIIAVGTTSVRTLETFSTGPRVLRNGYKTSRLYIRPGYTFQTVDGMFTNFHMPRTTMLLMLAALVGRDPLMESYRQAVQFRYRFLSFGDSMLIA